MENHSIKVQRTAHYSTYGKISEKTQYFFLACHGYGQLAKKFIRKFDVLDPETCFVLAPEGLSRFYWGGFTGEVVSSWMTKEDRLEEIADYSNYIQTLYKQYTAQLPSDCKIILFGFSQGCATIMRWAMREFPTCHYMLFWAGMIPEDIDYTPHLEYFEGKKLSFFYGDQDKLISPKYLAFIKQVIQESGIKNIREVPYEGDHRVVRSALKNWVDSILI